MKKVSLEPLGHVLSYQVIFLAHQWKIFYKFKTSISSWLFFNISSKVFAAGFEAQFQWDLNRLSVIENSFHVLSTLKMYLTQT